MGLSRRLQIAILVVAGGSTGCSHKKPVKAPAAHIPTKCIIGADVKRGKCEPVPGNPNVAICDGIYIHFACIEADKQK